MKTSGPEPDAKAVRSFCPYSPTGMTSYWTLMSGLAFSNSAAMALSIATRGG